jgi:hypothetical protein
VLRDSFRGGSLVPSSRWSTIFGAALAGVIAGPERRPNAITGQVEFLTDEQAAAFGRLSGRRRRRHRPPDHWKILDAGWRGRLG